MRVIAGFISLLGLAGCTVGPEGLCFQKDWKQRAFCTVLESCGKSDKRIEPCMPDTCQTRL